MTLEEAIKHAEEKSKGCSKCNEEHKQLAEWLKELKYYREKSRGKSVVRFFPEDEDSE